MSIKFAKLLTIVASCLVFMPISLAQTQERTKGKEPIAIIAGQAIYEGDLSPVVQRQLIRLREQEYQLLKQGINDLVNRKLLEAEARKNGISTEKLLEQEVESKVADPTDADLSAAYSSQKDRWNRPFDEVKPQLLQSLKKAKLGQARQDYFARLREQAKVSILLPPPRVEVGYDPARVRGNPKAPVMIVEFFDFQCPYCRKVQPTLEDLLAKHEGQVALAFRDFPLRQIHPQAELAAEAARCADEQGKFWEYHDLLLAHLDKLDRAGLVDQAGSLKLDEKQFDSCLSSEKYKAQIEQDYQEGLRVGVSGTPGFFINGIFLNGALPEVALEQVIESQLSTSHPRNLPSAP